MTNTDRKGFLRTTVVGGVLFLIPFIVILMIVEKALGLLDRLTIPLARMLAIEDLGIVSGRRLLAVLFLLLICFLAGLIARTAVARRLVDSLESNVLANVPGYAFFKNVGQSLVGVEDPNRSDPVLARIEDAWQVGFLMERLLDGQLVVFVPGAPDAGSGSIYVLTPDRVHDVDISMVEAVKVLRRLGRGWKIPVPPATHTHERRG